MHTADLHTIVIGREAMGCRFEVVFNAGEVEEATVLGCEALDLIEAIEERISVYRDASELTALNASAGSGRWISLSGDTIALLETARHLAAATGGAFDPASGGLVRCWGFRDRKGRTPSETDLAAALAVAGMVGLQLEPGSGRGRLLGRGAELDPGGIGKGWAIDRAIARLEADGVPSVLVHGGQSSVRAIGTQGPSLPGRAGWQVGLRHPLRPNRRLATIRLTDRALGTSGSGTRFFVERGHRLGHILDPRTGRPAEGVISATVLADSAAEADALATAAYVLGEPGLPTILTAGSRVAAILVVSGEQGGLRLLAAGVTPEILAIEPEPGLAIEWISGGSGADPSPMPLT
ncbi:MAG: FAD:protein FMN transferase [Planctomycetota bacterium]|nr:FAD:protein FMN transferase [Planctomycetota bacterium]MDA1202282.1 FAD:protein FMN transferase [Planctomycetota bacterium]